MNRKAFSAIFLLFLIFSTEANPTKRILGGRDAVRRQVPFIASLRNWGTTGHVASGVLISGSWVLTCAQILQNRAGNSFEIFLGIISLTNSPSGTISRRSSSVVPHPGFNPTSMANDIGLMEIGGTNFNFNEFLHPIFMESIRVDSPVTSMVAGWGSRSTNTGPNSDILQVLSVQTMTNEECQAVHGTERVSRDSICTRNFPGEGICTTDIGSPLVSNVQLIGIASWTDAPCGTARPDVYTRISSYRSWIGSIVGF